MALKFLAFRAFKEGRAALSDDIAGKSDTAFPEFMKDVFNVPNDRLDIVTTERECVSDQSLFLVKKKYALHMVKKEGIDESDLAEKYR